MKVSAKVVQTSMSMDNTFLTSCLFVCLFVTEETCQVCPAPASVRKRYEGAYGVNPMPVGHSEAAMTGIFTRL